MKTLGWTALVVTMLLVVAYLASELAKRPAPDEARMGGAPRAPEAARHAAAGPAKVAAASTSGTPDSPQHSPAAGSGAGSPVASDPEAAKEAILENIHDAATAYDASALPLIEPYLAHTDPEIRAAAVDGLVALGETGGAALLRDAARKLADPREAVTYLDAAEYLELPPITMKELGEEMAALAKDKPLEKGARQQRVQPPLKNMRPPPARAMRP